MKVSNEGTTHAPPIFVLKLWTDVDVILTHAPCRRRWLAKWTSPLSSIHFLIYEFCCWNCATEGPATHLLVWYDTWLNITCRAPCYRDYYSVSSCLGLKYLLTKTPWLGIHQEIYSMTKVSSINMQRYVKLSLQAFIFRLQLFTLYINSTQLTSNRNCLDTLTQLSAGCSWVQTRNKQVHRSICYHRLHRLSMCWRQACKLAFSWNHLVFYNFDFWPDFLCTATGCRGLHYTDLELIAQADYFL